MNPLTRDSAAPVAQGFPAYRIGFEREKRARYAVCVFVIDEGERIRKQLRGMKSLASVCDIIVADGGSSDGSLTRELMLECEARALLVKEGPGRLSAQMRMAIAYVLGEGYDGMVTIDGNGKDGYEAIPDFLRLLGEGYDHVQGSRFIPGGHHEHTPAARHWGVKLLHAPLVSLAAGFRYTDTTNGFRGYSRNLLLDPRVQPLRDVFQKYELHYYLAIRAARLGFRVIETPVRRVYPSRGKVPTKINSLEGNLLVLRTLFAACLRRYDP